MATNTQRRGYKRLYEQAMSRVAELQTQVEAHVKGGDAHFRMATELQRLIIDQAPALWVKAFGKAEAARLRNVARGKK